MGRSKIKGLVVKYPECTMDEVEPTIEILRDLVSLEVVELDQIGKNIECDFLIIPGGSCDFVIEHEGLKDLVRRVKRSSGLLAGICNGVLVLASSGVLKGEKCTHTAHPKYAPLPQFRELLEVAEKFFDGSEYVDDDLVVSGRIITAKPHVPGQFAKTVKSHLGV